MGEWITVHDFQWRPGENDREYINLLKEALDRQRDITYKAIRRLKEVSRKLANVESAAREKAIVEEAVKNMRTRGFAVCDGVGTRNYEHIKIPQRATKLSAGYDYYSPFDFTLQPGEDINIKTGLKAYMQPGEVLLAFPRSGLGFKYYCRMANTIGVVDADYYDNPENEGEIGLELRNEGDKPMTIKAGQGIAQFIFMNFLLADEDNFQTGADRAGGFGSTDALMPAT